MGRRLAAVCLSMVAALAACGGPMQPEELARSIQTLESTAAEGSLLAEDIAHDRTKATFARVHARDLSDVVVHEAEKLNDAEAGDADVAAAKTDAIDLADRIGQAIGRLQVAPGSEADGAKAADTLDRLSKDAGDLADQL
jgi:hypothetical protein